MGKYDLACSERQEKYFDYLSTNTQKAHELATKYRALGYDPSTKVEIKLAKNMAERVVGIISVVAPQIVGSGVVERIIELEKKYGSQDWRVAFLIAHEIAEQKYCTFETKIEAIEVGIRTGFAYVTVGVVSSPLEGLTSVEIKPRRDGKGEYFRLNYAGPIRNAGGTAASVSVLIADYVRKKLGYAKYDPDEKEIQRCYAELEDYHQYVANLQYFPYKEESEFYLTHLPVEIAGDPSERRELSNAGLKDLPRIETNFLRSGYCLIHSSCIPLKAPKLWKKIGKWGHDMGMEDWDFLEEAIKIAKNLKAKKSGNAKRDDDVKVKPDATFVADIVGGRPVLGHPMRSGGFRLRYGRGRASGYSGQSIHPATMHILNNYIATGTQLKVERPGKAAAFTPCDSILGPTVKLKDGSVIYLDDEEEAKKAAPHVAEILYLGDVLVNYGDFFDRAHILLPPGYCEEWWVQELSEAGGPELNAFKPIPFNEAVALSKEYKIPLHPKYIYYYKEISVEELQALLSWCVEPFSTYTKEKILLKDINTHRKGKRALELLGVEHEVQDGNVLITTHAPILYTHFNKTKDELSEVHVDEGAEPLKWINAQCEFAIKDKSGIFIGTRMGRPEKAKMRKMTGSPHGLFPIGEEGDRLRSFQAALQVGHVTADAPVMKCEHCDKTTILTRCETCDNKTTQLYIHPKTKEQSTEEKEGFINYTRQKIDLQPIFNGALKLMDSRIYPDLIKGVRGVMGKNRMVEHPLKSILRAKNEIAVNKDGTVRYDASELTLTHFKPEEIGTSIERLKELGYTHDVYGKPLTKPNQVLELFCQDVVLPACPVSPEEGSNNILLRTAQFIDDLLVHMYKDKPFYNATSQEDLVGHLVIGLAPHTSAGTVGRIIGFSQTQGLMAHPFYHASFRRDCDGDEAAVFLLMDAFLNFSQEFLPTTRGSTMDAPLVLTTVLNPAEVDDMAFNMDRVSQYPLEFYRACEEYKFPWDVKIDQIDHRLFTPEQFEGSMFTHDTKSINSGVLCSNYKLLPSMPEKIEGQMDLAKKIRAVQTSDVASLVIDKHFIRDMKGNLRKFSLQQFRCVSCNTKFRRPPLSGICSVCKGKIVFTISQGSIEKYLKISLQLAEEFAVNEYLHSSILLTKKRVVDVFGEEKEKQTGLGAFMQ